MAQNICIISNWSQMKYRIVTLHDLLTAITDNRTNKELTYIDSSCSSSLTSVEFNVDHNWSKYDKVLLGYDVTMIQL